MVLKHYVHIFRRRREGKTDYRKRKGIVLGKLPFMSVRISGRYIYAQVIKPTATGDITLCSSSSRDLIEKFGWKGSAKNIPCAYLTGLHLGQLAKNREVSNVIVYSGVGRFVHGSRMASVVNGAKDAGLEIEIDEKILPDESRLKGSHIAEYAKKLESEDKAKYDATFSKLLSSGLNPAEYSEHFDKVKSAIRAGRSN